MRVLLISCLLIGSITCVPVEKNYRSNNAGTSFMQPFGHMFSGEGMSSGPGSSSSLPSLPSPSSDKATQLPAPQNVPVLFPTGSGNTNMADRVHFPSWAPNAAQSSGYGNSATGGSYGGGYGSSASGYGDSATGGSYGGGYGSSASGYGDSAIGGSYGGGYGSSASDYGYGLQDESSNSGSAIDTGDETPEPVFSDVSDLEPVRSFSSRSSYQRGRATFAQSRYTPGGDFAPTLPLSSSRGTSQPNTPAKAPAKGGF